MCFQLQKFKDFFVFQSHSPVGNIQQMAVSDVHQIQCWNVARGHKDPHCAHPSLQKYLQMFVAVPTTMLSTLGNRRHEMGSTTSETDVPG